MSCLASSLSCPVATVGRFWHVRHCAVASTRPLQSWPLSVAEGAKGDFSTVEGAQKALAEWIESHPTRVGNIDRILKEIGEAAPDVTGHPRLAVVSVALRTLSSAS